MDQPKKYRVLLKPLGDHEDRRDLWHLYSKLKTIMRMERNAIHDHPFGNRKQVETEIKAIKAKLEAETKGMQPRTIDCDAIAIIDDGSMLMGIGPTKRTTISNCVTSVIGQHAKALKIRKENPEFYVLSHTPPGRDRDDPSHTDYIITRKFEKILSANLDNVISINGKPVMGGMRDLDSGVSQLESYDWSVDAISDLLED